MSYLHQVGVPFHVNSAGRLLASGNRAVVDGLVAERRAKYTAGRKEGVTALMRKEALEFHEAVVLATVYENELCNPEQILVEESLAWLDQQGVKYDRKEATQLILARDWGVLTPKWEARRQRVWLAKSPILEKVLAATAPEYLEAVLGAASAPECFWVDAFEKGRAYLEGKDVKADQQAGLRWLQHAASDGDARAQNELGECYECGNGVVVNGVEAVRWYRLAAEQGHAEAQHTLGERYDNGTGEEDAAEAARWYRLAIGSYRLAAEKGDVEALYMLGECYANGNGVEEDAAEAARWYGLAAEQGHTLAQVELGMAYLYGRRMVQQDFAEALKWLRLAAEQGNDAGQYFLGEIYENGHGVERDDAEAVMLYRKAAEQGHGAACSRLAEMYAAGQGVVRDDAEASRWQREADKRTIKLPPKPQ